MLKSKGLKGAKNQEANQADKKMKGERNK